VQEHMAELRKKEQRYRATLHAIEQQHDGLLRAGRRHHAIELQEEKARNERTEKELGEMLSAQREKLGTTNRVWRMVNSVWSLAYSVTSIYVRGVCLRTTCPCNVYACTAHYTHAHAPCTHALLIHPCSCTVYPCTAHTPDKERRRTETVLAEMRRANMKVKFCVW
jgi:hypothetical protein